MTNSESKMVNEVGGIPVAGQTKFHPEMIANFLSLNEMTKNTKYHSIQEMKIILGCILEIILLNLQLIMVGFVSVKWIRFFRKVAEENKRNIIEGLKHLQTVGETKKIFSERQYN